MIAAIRTRVVSWEGALAVLTIALLILGLVTTPGFSSPYNFQSSVANMSEKALMALPLALLVLVRHIDISIASTAALSGIVMSLAIEAGQPIAVGIALAVAVGIVCGAINGFFVTVLGMPSLLVTLGTLSLFRGLCYVLVGGKPILAPAAIINFGNGAIPGTSIPLAIIPLLIAAPIFSVILHKTVVGRRLHAMGGNPETARYSGVNNARLTFALFVVCGVLAAVAGIIATGRSSSASPASLFGAELDCITVVFLGGFSFLGGSGRLAGVLWAIALVIEVRSILLLNGASGDGQATAVGVLLIVSLLTANIARRLTASMHDRRARAVLTAAPATT
ncbi:ABC transporter permease [Pengzhenrongella sp.]|jgi:rhamnose transport system permease protein|uniref:ABC transporter permease n=1 Tax=Pengzhenrongella sp. TaxID=2888820 RepID=UPI002F93AEA4